jgi:hypothetical protein
MTQPQPQPDRLTYQQALAAVVAAKAAQAAAPSLTTAAVGTLSNAVAAARDTAAGWALNLITGLWDRVDVYDGAAVQAFTEKAGGYMVTAQTTVARTAAAAQTNIVAGLGVRVPGRVSDPDDVRGTPVFDDTAGRFVIERGTQDVDYDIGGRQVVDLDADATTVGMFNRPARTQRYLESTGIGSAEAHQKATERLQVLVADNLMLAQRLAEAEIIAQAADEDDRIIGTRRIIHPELSRTGTCGLCIAASDRIYKVRELAPMHDRCCCTFAAVTEDFDPADELNKVDLAAIYADAGDTTNGAALKRTRYQVDEHGELGPVLIPAKPYKRRKPQSTARRRAVARI